MRLIVAAVLACVCSSAMAGVQYDAAPSFDVARPAIDTGARYLAHFPFTTPGCYPTGSAMGTRGQTITVSRPGTRTCNVAAAGASAQLVTCADNEACVEASGLLVEPARTNYVLTSGSGCKAGNVADTGWTIAAGACVNDTGVDPTGTTSMDTYTSTNATGTIYTNATLPSTTGPVTISAWVSAISTTADLALVFYANGATVNGPCTCYRSDGGTCTAAAGSTTPNAWGNFGSEPTLFSLTCTGFATTQTSFNFSFHDGRYTSTFGVGGKFWGTQIESGAYATSYIPTAGAAWVRGGDMVSITNPLAATNPSSWCVGGTFTPENGRTWANIPAVLASTGTYSAAGGRALRAFSTNLYGYSEAASPPVSVSHGFVAGSSHRVALGQSGIATSIYDDSGWRATGNAATAATQHASMWLGSNSGFAGEEFGGYIQNFKVSRGPCR